MYLQDMLTGMERISQYIEGFSLRKFKQDYKTIDAVIRNFEIIGEASKIYPKKSNQNTRKCPGLKCIYWETRYLTNTLVLIMRLSGM